MRLYVCESTPFLCATHLRHNLRYTSSEHILLNVSTSPIMFISNAVFLALLATASVEAFLPRNSGLKSSTSLFAKPAPVPDNETADEMRVRMKAKARKMMFNENGVAYAPWVTKQINEEAIIEGLILKEQGGPVKKKTSILDRGEIESSEGMKWRMSGDQVELAWVTGFEDDNKGYIVEKRPSYGGDFQEVASFKEVSQLASKGQTGGRYRYSDPSSAAGSWIYRIMDCDSNDKRDMLCQCFVEVVTESESKSQGALAAGLAVFFLAAFAVGYSMDPPY